jgi:Leucine-rich repeat (LRR) protein
MKQLWYRQIKKGVTLFSVLVLSSTLLLADFENVDCIKDQKVLGISTVECKVLEKLWESTDGKEWQENKGWDSVTKVNSWEGISVENGKISTLLLYSNKIKGKIPSELGELDALKRLSFFNNNLFGSIPSSLGKLTKLEYLDLGSNNFSANIPASLALLSNLKELYLNNNQLSGNIPNTLGDLVNLHVLKLYDNNLSGAIPLTLGSLSNLDTLSLAENNLTGVIPSELGVLSKLSFLDLKSNQLSGEIPAQLGNIESLTGLYMQHNRLTGVIPSELGSLLNLTDLDLSDNKLKGELPVSLGQLSILTYLNISSNKLSGDIPLEILDLSRLNYLNLEENYFLSESIEAIGSKSSYIPECIISSQKNEVNSSLQNILPLTTTKEDVKTIDIKVLSEEEIAMLEMATLKIVGTDRAGDSLFVENEGKWKIEEDSIIFTPIEDFKGTPTPISYTIKNGDGVELSAVKIFVKRNKTKALTINLLENIESNRELYSVDILVSEDFMSKHPESLLSKNRKELTVDSEGVWRVESNGTVVFTPEENFTGNPTSIEYLLLKNSGDKSAVGIIDMNHKPIIDEDIEYANTVDLFGINGLLLMILLGGLYGVFYIRELENKKL